MSQKFEWMLPKQIKEVSAQQADDCLHTITEELECLELVINAADAAKTKAFEIDSERRRTSFLELRRHAFGKTVVVKTKDGVQTFRVSQANCEYASTKIGYASPLSPVGKLCRLAQVGYDGCNGLWGDFEVLEVRTFGRYIGQESEDNIRNFKLMQKRNFVNDIDSDKYLFNVMNLRASVRKWFKGSAPLMPTFSPESQPIETDDLLNAPAVKEQPEATFDFEGFHHGYDEQDDDEREEVEHGDLLHSDYETDDFYGISNHFYLNPTKKQMELMSSHVSSGPMLVEGIAGSGKTCVAIGRAKTLCDGANGGERLAGDNSNDFFAQESSVGFVRTGELVQYLKATCNELGLSHMPIQEYKVLQHDLRTQRDLEQRPNSPVDKDGNALFPKYKYLKYVDYNVQAETTMAWLKKVDALIGRLLAERYSALDEKVTVASNVVFSQQFTQETATQILNNLLVDASNLFSALQQELTSTSETYRPFCIDSYAKKANKILTELDKNWFNKESLWVNPEPDTWLKVKTNKEAISRLQDNNASLLRIAQGKVSALLLMSVSELEIALEHISEFYDSQGEVLSYVSLDELWLELSTQKCRCKFAGQILSIEISQQDDILFCAAAGTLAATINGKRLFPAVAKNPLYIELKRVNKEGETSKTSLSKLLRTQINALLFNRLKYADIYLAALKLDDDGSGINPNKVVIDRLEACELADHDIDVLLALAQVMSRGAKDLKSAQYHLSEQENYFRTVFIDEVQDFSEVQVFLMGRQAHPQYNAITMVGDLYQQLYAGSASDPALCFPYQGSIEKSLLIENKRQEHKPNLMALSSLFRAKLQHDTRLIPESSTYQTILDNTKNDDMRLLDVPFDKVDEQVIQLIKAQPKGRTVSVVCPTTELAIELEARLHPRLASEDFRESYVAEKVDLSKKYLVHFSSPEHIKGLEFDTLIMAGFENMDWDRADELNKVYVCISRPRKQLAVLADFTKIPNEFIELFA